VNIVELETKTLDELRDIAREKDVSGYSRLKKDDLILRLLKAHAEEQGFIFGGGVLDIIQDGIGFLRSDHLLPGSTSMSRNPRFGVLG
jgi:transcription termination factor Rho